MRILLATRNDHKTTEIAAALRGRAEVIDLRALPALVDDIPETGHTFVDNAFEKARFVAGWLADRGDTDTWVAADDSGIEVDALGGAPGVFSKRFSPEGTDEANNALLLAKLTGRTDRTARYRCVIAVVGPTDEFVVDGACEGTIGLDGRGSGGFGYDPYFCPVEAPGRTMAELTLAEKNAISHRGRAVERLTARLAQETP